MDADRRPGAQALLAAGSALAVVSVAFMIDSFGGTVGAGVVTAIGAAGFLLLSLRQSRKGAT